MKLICVITLAFAIDGTILGQTQSTATAPAPDPSTPRVVGHPPTVSSPHLLDVDGSDLSASTNDPNVLRAQIAALKVMQASYRARLAVTSPDFQQYEEIQYTAEQKRQQLSQMLQGEAQRVRANAEDATARARKAAVPKPPPTPKP